MMQDSHNYFSEVTLFDSTCYRISERNSQCFIPEEATRKMLFFFLFVFKSLKIIRAYLEAQVFLNP